MIAFRSYQDEMFRESCLRMIGQIIFDNSPNIQDVVVQQVYKYAQKISFLNDQVFKEQKNQKSRSLINNHNQIFYKTLRAAFNCIANLLA
jgi:hypothetical protein